MFPLNAYMLLQMHLKSCFCKIAANIYICNVLSCALSINKILNNVKI